MYIAKHFEETRVEVMHELIRSRPLASLVTLSSSGLNANHIPLYLSDSPAPYGSLRGHVARANSIVGVPFALSGEAPALLLRSTGPAMLALLAALALVSALAKAGKFHLLRLHLGDRPGFARSLRISVASDFAFLVSPGGTAGYVLCAALLRRAGNSWSKATSVVAGEQALDIFFFMVALPLAALSASESVLHLMGAVPAGVFEAIFIAVVLGAGTPSAGRGSGRAAAWPASLQAGAGRTWGWRRRWHHGCRHRSSPRCCCSGALLRCISRSSSARWGWRPSRHGPEGPFGVAQFRMQQ